MLFGWNDTTWHKSKALQVGFRHESGEALQHFEGSLIQGMWAFGAQSSSEHVLCEKAESLESSRGIDRHV